MGIGRKIWWWRVLLVGTAFGLLQAPGAMASTQIHGEACEFRIKLNVTYSCQLEFAVRSSDGYRITVSGTPGAPGVEVIVQGPQGEAQYTDETGKVTGTSITASLGRLGTVAMQFRPSGAKRSRRIPSSCEKGRPPSVSSQPGTFVGTFTFHGEQGYTHVAVHRARGGLGDPLTNLVGKPLSCSYHATAAERKREDESVGLTASPARKRTVFSASRMFGSLLKAAGRKGRDPFLFLVLESEKADGLSILRSTAAVGDSSSFTYDPSLTSAAVTPPGPFSGTGTFRRNVDGTTEWSGGLAVALPGLGSIALTPGKASLETVAESVERLEEELKPRRTRAV